MSSGYSLHPGKLLVMGEPHRFRRALFGSGDDPASALCSVCPRCGRGLAALPALGCGLCLLVWPWALHRPGTAGFAPERWRTKQLEIRMGFV